MSNSFEKQLHRWTHMLDEAMEDKSLVPLALHSGMSYDELEKVINPGLKYDHVKILDKLVDALSSYDIYDEICQDEDGSFCFEVGTKGEWDDDCCGPYETGRKYYIPTKLEDEEIIDDIEKFFSDTGFEIRWKIDYKKDAWPEEDLRYEMESIPCKPIYDEGYRCYPDNELPVDAHVILKGKVFVTDPEKAKAAYLGSNGVVEDEDGEIDENANDYKHYYANYPGRDDAWYQKMMNLHRKYVKEIEQVKKQYEETNPCKYKVLTQQINDRYNELERKLVKLPVQQLVPKAASEDNDDLTHSPDFDPKWMDKDMYLARTNDFYHQSTTDADGNPTRWWTISEDPSTIGFSRKSSSWKVTPAGKQKIFNYLRYKSSREDFDKGEALFQELVDPANGLAELFRQKSMDPKTQVVPKLA